MPAELRLIELVPCHLFRAGNEMPTSGMASELKQKLRMMWVVLVAKFGTRNDDALTRAECGWTLTCPSELCFPTHHHHHNHVSFWSPRSGDVYNAGPRRGRQSHRV